MRSRAGVWLLAVCFGWAGCVAGVGVAVDAADAEGLPPSVDAESRAEILAWIRDTLSTRYVEPVVARAMVDEIRRRAAAGAYDGLDDGGEFLHQVEKDLRAASDDKHVALWPERPEDVKDDEADYTPADPVYVEHLRRTNYGFKKLEILPGNIGYLRIDEFAHPAVGGPTAVAVMNSVASVDALIVDLRFNGGGAGLVNLIGGYFFDEPTRLNDVWERKTGETEQGWTPEYVPGPSLSHVPLYILTSAQTFSAAEDFAYGLKHAGRAKVVGERSRGGGHPVEIVRMVGDTMAVAMMVPNARSINHVTHTSWEGVGVAPDIEVPAARALEAACDAAVDELLQRAGDDEQERRLVEWGRRELACVLHPVTTTPAELAEVAGVYGTRTFVVGDDGVLLYRRDAGSTYPLVPLGDDLFGFEGYDDLRFQFERDGHGVVDRVAALGRDGSRTVRPRSAEVPTPSP